jgi:hypothetical protein
MYCRNICLHFVEDFDEQRLDDDSYLYDLNVSAVRHYVAIMKELLGEEPTIVELQTEY